EPGRAPPAAPGAEVVDEPAPAHRAPDLECRSEREKGLAAAGELPEREREQRRLAHLVGSVIGEQVKQIMGEDRAIAKPRPHRIERGKTRFALPLRLHAALYRDQPVG